MKCLPVCQPWAWAIIHGPKRVENRSWSTTYRGPLLIYAGRSRRFLGDTRLPDGTPIPPESELVFGAILGLVDLVGCVPVADVSADPFAEGPICLVLANSRPFQTPIPYQGALRIFDVPDAFIRDPVGYLLYQDN
jgi:hypothetical protein